MKLNKILSEIAQVEYSDAGVKSDTKSSSAIENVFVKAIERAFLVSQELKQKYQKNESPFDIQISKIGPNIKIVFNPEDGSKQNVGTFPMEYLSKYIKDPNGLANVLLNK